MSKLITILGAGESGTGAAILAKAKGYTVFVSEKNAIQEKFKTELTKHSIDFEEGAHTVDRVLASDLIIKSPGIPETVAIVKQALAKGIDVIDEIEFASRFTDAKIIAITGTNGKTTTTMLTYHLLKAANFNVGLGGNIGSSFARQVAEQNYEWYVLEVSSFQLDGTKDFAPAISVLLNITPDHLDRYGYAMENYIASKFRIVQSMRADQHVVYFKDDSNIQNIVALKSIVPQQISVSLTDKTASVFFDGVKMNFQFDEDFSIEQKDTTLRGPHNLINTMAAVSAAVQAGVSVAAVRKGLKTFINAPHRLESVATINDIVFVNDSKATNVDAVVYALGSYDQPLVWIAGGVDKGNDYTAIEHLVREKVKTLICLGVDNEKLKTAFKDSIAHIEETQSVHDLVRMALAAASAGDVVLLSPACASFDLFKNYEDRGDQFKKAVLSLKAEVEN